MKADTVPPRRPDHWGALAGCLLDFEAFPGRFPLTLREPRLLFDHGTEVLSLASGRAVEGLPRDAALETRLRQAARYFVRTALLRPGVDHYTLLGLAPGFDPALLREHYRMLIRLTHPDFAAAGGEWPASAATRINQANDVLSSPQRRQDYDLAHPRGRQWAPSVHAPVMPRPVAGAKPPVRRGFLAVRRRRGVFAGVAGALALGLGVWFWSGTSDGDLDLTLGHDTRLVAPEPAAAPASALAAVSPAPEPASAPAPSAVSPAPVAPVPAAPMPAQASAPALEPQRPAGLTPAPALPELAPAPAAAPAAAPVHERPAPVVVPAPVRMAAAAPAPAAAVVAQMPVATAAAAVLPPPAPVAAPQPAQPAAAAPAVRPPPARDAGTQGARVGMADVQPLLGQLLGVLQSGRGEQVLRWVEPSTRPGDGADGFVQTYNRLVAHSRNVRLGPAQFSGRPMGEQLHVDGVVMLYLQDENQQPVTRELVLRAQFASRGGQPVLTQLSASEALK